MNINYNIIQGGEGKLSSPVWQFQMGDPEALNAAEQQLYFMSFQKGGSFTHVLFAVAAMIVQIFMARII